MKQNTISQQRPFHLLSKPTGATCNLDCKYCFFLSKETLYPGDRFRMSNQMLETYIRQLLEAQPTGEVEVAWQGGEPTLMGLDFFKRSIDYVEKYRKPSQTILHTIQTNGTLLNGEWCAFFKQHPFLIGLSVDGPKTMHDANRVNKAGAGSFDQVRGIYHKGWTAVTRHKTPWLLMGEKTVPFDDDNWELYDTSKDWSQANNLALQMPEKLYELQRLWLIEATRRNVLPLDDRGVERAIPEKAGRPLLIKGNSQILFGSMGHLSENSVVNIKNKSHSVTAEIFVPTIGAEGVIVCQGGNIGGWGLYAKGGKLKYCYNLFGIHQFFAESSSALTPGDHQVRMEFAYAGGGLGKGGTASLYVDGKKGRRGHGRRHGGHDLLRRRWLRRWGGHGISGLTGLRVARE